MSYTYLVSSLPQVGLPDMLAELQIDDLQDRILQSLTKEDAELFRYLLYRNDNKNLLYILRKKTQIKENPLFTFHKPSIFHYQELEEGISGLFPLPNYMMQFLQDTNGEYQGSKTENLLIYLYYQEACKLPNEFLSNYFHFKRDLKNILSALNARKYGYNIEAFLLNGGSINDTLKNSGIKDFGLGGGIYSFVEELDTLLNEGRFTELEKTIDRTILNFLDHYPWEDPFSSTSVFQYFIRLSLSKRWCDLDSEKGKGEMIRTLDWVVKSASLPTEYAMEKVL
jgi:vacuolar-type H+-ATPase subunit C/Vma6